MKDVVQIAKVAKIYDGTAWVDLATSVPDLSNYQLKSEGGLTFVKKQTIGTAVSSVTVTDAFSATYDSYEIVISGGSTSTTISADLTLGSTATGYYSTTQRIAYSGGASFNFGRNNDVAFTFLNGLTDGMAASAKLINPFLAKKTIYQAPFIASSTSGVTNGFLDNTTSYTAFTITAATGTITGGDIYVYGYNKG